MFRLSLGSVLVVLRLQISTSAGERTRFELLASIQDRKGPKPEGARSSMAPATMLLRPLISGESAPEYTELFKVMANFIFKASSAPA
jgi:hypothetical protein